ncbi:capsule biosynthesis protein CapA [Amylibacter marinus]|uniref:Capsule biosynthesis protein CapA n=1 Tax=Amylibacter marinus TaxID=1475483 RepID=A0ABQ5VTS9_9RHOB|nr:capsule biosynthesis protein CapA [Amylibacter marinus]GLQ34676.1 capsule biosynthesis protein CapA [Amylibacter marinus]
MASLREISRPKRKFVFLQGPHGPFFYELSRILQSSGAEIVKIGFNQGDARFWPDHKTYIAFKQPQDEWAQYLSDYLARGVTDLVIYGDHRVFHAQAIKIAKDAGVTIHCFEEGYMRPYWTTYERGGVNGHSRLMNMSIDEMRSCLGRIDEDQPEAPARWGELRRHALYGAIYHLNLFLGRRKYPNYRGHRTATLGQELWAHCKRLILMPYRWAKRMIATRRITNKGYVYHVALMQLGHDSSIAEHSDYRDNAEFIHDVISGFVKKAPAHHHLVFKAHPLEDYRERPDRVVAQIAAEFGVAARVHFLHGGKLAAVLDFARSVITINSTAAQQALWRGLPVKTLGRSVYSKPELVSQQTTADFFAQPNTPDLNAYRDYRRFLLVTSQITGGFYARKSRARLTRQAVDLVLSSSDPYDLISQSPAAPMQQIKLIK